MSGLNKIKKRVSNGEFMVVPTDKSGRLAVQSRDSYVASMEPHIRDNPEISLADRNGVERLLNAHCLQLGRILKIGYNHKGHWDRVKSAFTNKFGHVPVLYGLVKDHKARTEGQPMKTRPVCGADEGSNAQLSHMLSVIVAAITETLDEELKVTCRSTEEMLCSIEEVNSRTDIDDLTVLSGDYEAMYPSLVVDEVATIAAEEFLESRLEVDMDWIELSLYLAVNFTRKELIDMGLGDVTHTRVTNSGRRPGVTTKEILERSEDTVSKFNFPVSVPSSEQQRKMFSVALKVLIKTAMDNHLFSFNGSLFRQRKGGAIGSTLTGGSIHSKKTRFPLGQNFVVFFL